MRITGTTTTYPSMTSTMGRETSTGEDSEKRVPPLMFAHLFFVPVVSREKRYGSSKLQSKDWKCYSQGSV